MIDTIGEHVFPMQPSNYDDCMQIESVSDEFTRCKVELKNWSIDAKSVFSPSIFVDLFQKTARYINKTYTWSTELARNFDNKGKLTYHLPCQRVNKLTHKTSFSLKEAKIKIAAVEQANIDIMETHDTPWTLLASNCSISIMEPTNSRGLSLQIPNNKGGDEPVLLESQLFSPITGRSLNTNSLGKIDQWCIIRSHDHVRVTFSSEKPGIFVLNTSGQCSISVNAAFIEFWTNITPDFPLSRIIPHQFSIVGARFFYQIYTTVDAHKLPHDANQMIHNMSISDSDQFHLGGVNYYENMIRFRILMDIVVYFTDSRTNIPYFYYDNEQLAIRLINDGSILIYNHHKSLAYARIDTNSHIIYFVLILDHETTRSNLLAYHVY